MNAIAYVLINKETSLLFLAYPLWFRFPSDEIVVNHKIGIFYEIDEPAAYAVQFEDEIMLINKEMYQKKIDQGFVEVLGEL